MAAKRTAPSYNAGFLKARVRATDESDGSERITEGLDIRIRCADISMYQASAAGVVAIWFRGESTEDAVEVIATVAEVDKIMARANLKEVQSDG